MRADLVFRTIIPFCVLTLLCSCATTHHLSAIIPASELPADIPMNQDAGRGGHLIIPLRVGNGPALPFLADTGSPLTLLDKAFEPKLGKCLDTVTIVSLTDIKTSGRYTAPKIYLGNTPLMTGGTVVLHGNSAHKDSSDSAMGTLGLDCLQHYCIQLDFKARKIHFLNPDLTNTTNLGEAFPITFKCNHPFIHRTGLLGKFPDVIIDTGCNIDCLVENDTFKGQAVLLPKRIWDGRTYTNLIVVDVDHANALGLDFLGRHLVTLDFPKHMLYLKQTDIAPLDALRKASRLGAPMQFIETLKENGQLPGISKNDQRPIYLVAHTNFGSKSDSNSVPESATFELRKDNNSSINRYTIIRVSKDGPWKLQ